MKKKYSIGLVIFCTILISLTCCEINPPQKRMLLIDYNLSPPVVHSALSDIFYKEGCTINYRQFYPDLVKNDIAEYDIIALFAGKTPDIPGAQMNHKTFDLLKRFVKNGGVLLLGSEPGGINSTGDHDRNLFNELLKELNIPITINNDFISDTKQGYESTLLFRPYYQSTSPEIPMDTPFPLDISATLNVNEPVKVFASGPESGKQVTSGFWPSHFEPDRNALIPNAPVIAAGKYEQGYVFVFSRYIFNSIGFSNSYSSKPFLALDKLKKSKKFLTGFAEYVIGLLHGKTRLSSSNITFTAPPDTLRHPEINYYSHDIKETLPENVSAEVMKGNYPLWDNKNNNSEEKFLMGIDKDLYSWILNEGIKCGWTHTITGKKFFAAFANLCKFTELNTIWGITRPQAFFSADSFDQAKYNKLSEEWHFLDDRLTGTGAHWFMGMQFSNFRAKMFMPSGSQGQYLRVGNIAGPEFWNYEFFKPLKLIAEFSKNAKNIAGIVFDTEYYNSRDALNEISQGFGYDNGVYSRFLEDMNGKIDVETWTAIADLKGTDRMTGLIDRGLLERYYQFLESIVEIYVRDLKLKLLKINPDLIFCVHNKKLPSNWFIRGFLKGLSTAKRPVIYFSFEPAALPYLDELRKDFIYILPVSAALMGMIRDFSAAFEIAYANNYGYWLNRASFLTNKEMETDIETPWGKTSKQAADAMRYANSLLKKRLNGNILNYH